MDFCLCGNSTCICETSCICIQHGCLCNKCRELRKEGSSLPFESISPSEFELFSPKKELVQKVSDLNIIKCEFSSRLPANAGEIHCPSSSSEVAKKVNAESGSIPVPDKVLIEPEPSVPKIETRAKDLQQATSNKKSIPTEQEMISVQDIGTNKLFQPKSCSPENSSSKDSFCKASHKQEKQVYKSITYIKGQSLVSNNDSESSSDEIPVAEEALDYFSSSSECHQPKKDEPDSQKLGSDISSTSSGSSSGVSVIDFPENEWYSNSQAEPHFADNHLIAISSIQLSPDQINNLHLQQESTTPTAMFSEEIRHYASSGRSISPIQIISRYPTAVVSYSGELYLLPFQAQDSRSSGPVTPLSDSKHVSQSSKSSKALPDSTKSSSSAADIFPINMQNSEKLQRECRKETSSALETCNTNVQENEQEKENPHSEERENLSEKNLTNVSDNKITPDGH